MLKFNRRGFISVAVFVVFTIPAFANVGRAARALDTSRSSSFAFLDTAAKTFGFERGIDPYPFLVVPDPGDIVVVAYNSDVNDTFALLTTVAIPGGTRFFIADNGWSTSLNGLVREGNTPSPSRQVQFDVAAGGLPAGTVIKFDQTNSTNISLVTPAQGTLTMVSRFPNPVNPQPDGTGLSFTVAGDQILIYKTSDNTPTGAVTMISGFNPSISLPAGAYSYANGWLVGTVPLVGNDGATTQSNAPAGLVVYDGSNASTATAFGIGSFAVSGGLIGQDNYRFNGICAQPDKTAYLTAINSPSNWVANDTTEYDLSTVCPGGATAPEINVQGNAANIADGSVTPSAADHTNFGSTAVTGGTLNRTFTIQNLGTANLSVTGITFTGTNSAEFSLSGISFPATVAPAGSTTFSVTFDPAAAGARTATINIANNDSNEAVYDFAVQGTGYNVIAPTGTAPTIQWSSLVQNGNVGTTRAVGNTATGDVIAASRINSGTAADLRITRHVAGTGAVSWTRDINSGNSDEVLDMVVDPANGDAYIAAQASVASNLNWFIYKINGSDGTVAWTYTHDGTGASNDVCFDIARTSDGNVVAAGSTTSTGGFVFGRVAKINASTGAEIWPYVNPTSGSQFSGVATDGSGNTYVTGFINAATGDGLTVKLNSAGASQWATVFNGVNNLSDSFAHVVVAPSGDPVVAGISRQSATNSDAIVIKYAAANGAQTWQRFISGAALVGNESINNLVVDGAGDLYVAGAIRNISSSDRDAFVSKITGAGASAWIATKFGSGADSDDRYQNVRVLGSDVYAVGNLDNTAGKDILVSRFDGSTGAETWSTTFNGTGNGLDDVYSCKHVMTMLGTDALALGGETLTASGVNGIVLKYAVSPDLTVTKTNTVAGATVFGNPWDWRLDVANGVAGPATFTTGQVIVRDDLPNTNVGYGAPALSNQVGITGTISCTITTFTLTCSASGGSVTIAASGGFRVSTTSTPTSIGTFGNPRAAGVCAVDPNLNVLETNESNNACSGSVTVGKANTTTSVASSQNPSLTGQSVTFTATVSVTAPGVGTPTGNVTFLDGGVAIGTCTNVSLTGVTAQCAISALTAASHTITATYNGDSSFNASPAGAMAGNPQVVSNTAVWDGSASSAWNDPANWATNLVPVATHDVLLPAAGVTNQAAIPTGSLTVNSLTVAAGRTLALTGGNLTINGLLTMSGGNITVNAGSLLVFGTTATVNRTSGHVIGDVQKLFGGLGTFTFPVGTGASAYSPLAVTVTAGSGQLTVRANTGMPVVTPVGLDAARTLQRYWTLSGSGITSNLTFQYLDGDIPATPGTENLWNVIRVTGNTAVRFPPGPTIIMNAAANTFTVNNVSVFSHWTAGESLAPTAASVVISGRVVNANGRGVSGAQVMLQNQQGDVVWANTNPFGYYRFTGVPAGQTYIVSARHKRFEFQARIVNVLDDLADVDLVAEP